MFKMYISHKNIIYIQYIFAVFEKLNAIFDEKYEKISMIENGVDIKVNKTS